jgi:hypothetical protein
VGEAERKTMSEISQWNEGDDADEITEEQMARLHILAEQQGLTLHGLLRKAVRDNIKATCKRLGLDENDFLST